MDSLEKRAVYAIVAILTFICIATIGIIWGDKKSDIDNANNATVSNRFDYISRTYELQLKMDSKINKLMLSQASDSQRLTSLVDDYNAAKKKGKARLDSLDVRVGSHIALTDNRLTKIEGLLNNIINKKELSILGFKY